MKGLYELPAVLCLAFACSGPKPEPAVPPPAPKAVPTPNSALPTESQSSDALRSVSPDASIVLRLHGDRLRQGPVFGAIAGLKEAIPQARQGLAIAQAGCGFDPLEAIEEIVIGAQQLQLPSSQDSSGRLLIDPNTATVAIVLDRPAEDALRCLQNFIPMQATQVGETKALALPTGGVLQARQDLLIYTPKGLAATAAQRIDSGAPLQAGLQATLDGNPDAMALVYGNELNSLNLRWASLALSHPSGGIEVRGVGLAQTAENAEQLQQRIMDHLAQSKKLVTERVDNEAIKNRITELLDRISIETNGASLNLLLLLDEHDARQFFSEVVVQLAKDGVHQYAAAAKTAEARDNVMRIALALSDYARANPAPGRRFPPSAPRTPADIPGRTPSSDLAGFEHASWKAIGFAPREPVYYSYEFVTGQDGNSVQVIARGDLDDDGEQSSYSIQVAIDGKEPKIASELTRQSPYE